MWAGSEADIAKRTIDIDTGILNLAMMSHLFNTFPQVGCFCFSSLHITSKEEFEKSKSLII